MDIYRQNKKNKLKRAANLLFLFLVIAYYSLFILFVYFWLFGFISGWLLIGAYISISFLYGILLWKVKELKKRYEIEREKSLEKFMWGYIKGRIGQIFISVGLIFIGIWYFNDVSPYSIKQYTLENKITGQTVVFQEMIHIGGRDFYHQVSEDIRRKSHDGYTLYYEEVLPTEEDAKEEVYKDYLTHLMLEKLSENRFGGDNTTHIMKQRNEDLIFNANYAVRADISNEKIKQKTNEINLDYKKYNISEIKDEALIYLFFKNAKEQKKLKEEISKKIHEGNLDEGNVNAFEKILKYYIQSDKNIEIKDLDIENLAQKSEMLFERMNNGDTQSFLMKGFINAFFSLNSALSQKDISLNNVICEVFRWSSCEDFQSHVIDYRDIVLAEYVLLEKDDKIFITYGKAHFNGFLKALNKRSLEKGRGEFIIKESKSIKVF